MVLDKITNFYEKLPDKQPTKNDPYFKNHMIASNSRIGLIGGSGSGKTQFLLNFLERCGPRFFDIFIYTTDVDEPLMKLLKSKMNDVFITNDINEIPSLKEFVNDKREKLMVFDDFITLGRKELTKLDEYAVAGRKYGFTTIFMVQNYTQMDKTISRNLNYIVLFKLTDTYTLKHILKNHNIFGIKPEQLNFYYKISTNEKFNFLLLDLNPENKKIAFRHNFLHFFPPPN